MKMENISFIGTHDELMPIKRTIAPQILSTVQWLTSREASLERVDVMSLYNLIKLIN